MYKINIFGRKLSIKSVKIKVKYLHKISMKLSVRSVIGKTVYFSYICSVEKGIMAGSMLGLVDDIENFNQDF